MQMLECIMNMCSVTKPLANESKWSEMKEAPVTVEPEQVHTDIYPAAFKKSKRGLQEPMAKNTQMKQTRSEARIRTWSRRASKGKSIAYGGATPTFGIRLAWPPQGFEVGENGTRVEEQPRPVISQKTSSNISECFSEHCSKTRARPIPVPPALDIV